MGTSETTLHNHTDVAKCPRPLRIVLVFPILPTLPLDSSFTHVQRGVQKKVQPHKGLGEARICSPPISDLTTRALYDYVVIYDSTPQRLLQSFNDLTDFALGRGLPSAKHEFHDKCVLESFKATNRETSSGSRTTKHTLHGPEVIDRFPPRRVHAIFSVLPTPGVFTLPGSIHVQFSDGPGNKSRKKATANPIFSSAWSKLRAEVRPSAARSDVVGAPPAGGPYVRVCVKHWLAAPPFPVATSPRWRPPVSVCPETAAPLRRPLIPFSAACRLLLSGTATSARGRLILSSAHGVVTSTFSWDQLEPVSDSGLPPFQDFSLFHLLVFDSSCEPSVLQNSTTSPQKRSFPHQRCSLVLGETPSPTFTMFLVARSKNQDAQASTSTSSTAAPVQAPSLRANYPLRAPAGGKAVDSGGGEQPTPTPKFIHPFIILSFAADAEAPQADVSTLLAFASAPPATPMQEGGNYPLCAPAGGNAVDSGGGEKPTLSPNSICSCQNLSGADARSQAGVPTPLALATAPPTTPFLRSKLAAPWTGGRSPYFSRPVCSSGCESASAFGFFCLGSPIWTNPGFLPPSLVKRRVSSPPHAEEGDQVDDNPLQAAATKARCSPPEMVVPLLRQSKRGGASQQQYCCSFGSTLRQISCSLQAHRCFALRGPPTWGGSANYQVQHQDGL